jgi:hypothetical protein
MDAAFILQCTSVGVAAVCAFQPVLPYTVLMRFIQVVIASAGAPWALTMIVPFALVGRMVAPDESGV